MAGYNYAVTSRRPDRFDILMQLGMKGNTAAWSLTHWRPHTDPVSLDLRRLELNVRQQKLRKTLVIQGVPRAEKLLPIIDKLNSLPVVSHMRLRARVQWEDFLNAV